MAPLICLQTIALENQPELLQLELAAGMQALCITSGDQELRRLLQLCCGMVLPTQGQVLLDGVDTADLSRLQLLDQRRSIGIVTATGGLIANLKLWENITLPLLYHHGTLLQKTEQHALDLLTAFGYTGNLLTLPGHLSSFERRMAAFIRAAISSPRLMVYAGCFDNLTADQRGLLFRQSQQLHQENPELASLYLTTSSTALQELQPDVSINLRHHATTPARSA